MDEPFTKPINHACTFTLSIVLLSRLTREMMCPPRVELNDQDPIVQTTVPRRHDINTTEPSWINQRQLEKEENKNKNHTRKYLNPLTVDRPLYWKMWPTL